MDDTKKTARLAGWLYLVLVFAGLFTLMYVPRRLFVEDDASATVANILAHQTLFRSYILTSLFSELLFITVVLVLYRLFKDVNQLLAAAMVLLVLLSAPAAFLSSAIQFVTLAFAQGEKLLTVFDKPQHDALTLLLLTFDDYSTAIAEVFWGLWLLPLGMLVFRSGFLPRFLGIWLIVNGVAYVGLSVTRVILPDFAARAFWLSMPALQGELVFTLWLLIVGARTPRPRLQYGV